MIPIVSVGFILCALLWCAVLLWRYPAEMAMAVLGVVVLLDSLGVTLLELNVGATIYQDDVACAALVAAALIIAARNRAFPRHFCRPALILLGLAGLNFLRGALTYGLKPAGNGVRILVFLIVPFLALDVIGPALKLSIFSRAASWLCGAAFLFTALSIGRWVGILPVTDTGVDDPFRQIPRVLGADYPMIIAQALIIVIGLQWSRSLKLTGMLTVGLLATVVLISQHRSVWLATLAGLAWLAFQSLRYIPLRRWMQFALAGTAVAGIALILLVASGRTEILTSMLQANIEETGQQDSTLAWRLSGFGEAIDRTFSSGPVTMLLGPPSGRDLSDVASEASLHIHNRYIDTLAYYGVGGLVLLLIWLGLMVARIAQLKSLPVYCEAASFTGPILQAIMLSELVYFLGYYGNILHGVLLGLLWAASAQPSESVEAFHAGTLRSEAPVSIPVFT